LILMSGISGEARPHRAVILMYHSILDSPADPWGLHVSPRRFDEHMAVVRQHANPIALRDLEQALNDRDAPSRLVAVTFDDGYANNLNRAVPILHRWRVPATIFVTTGSVNGTTEFWWNELETLLLRPGRMPRRLVLHVAGGRHEWPLGGCPRWNILQARRMRRWRAWEPSPPTPCHAALIALQPMLRRAGKGERESIMGQLRAQLGTSCLPRAGLLPVNDEELCRLAAARGIEIGGHTGNHLSLGSLSAEEQMHEMEGSKRWLEHALQRRVDSFAYPFGAEEDFSAQTACLARQAGFARACSTIAGPISSHSDVLQLRRFAVQNWTGGEFAARLERWFAAPVDDHLVTTTSTRPGFPRTSTPTSRLVR